MQQTIKELEQIVTDQTRNIDVLADSIGHLATALDDRPTKKEARRFSLVVNMVTLLVIGLLVITSIISTNANRQSIDDSNRVLDKIEDCLSKDGKCYQESQTKQGMIVKEIICRQEEGIARGYATAGLPPYQYSPECDPANPANK